MPAKKPPGLHTRHDAKSDRESRGADDAAMKPVTKLDVSPPVDLRGHPYASELWERIVSLYHEIKGDIITAFDRELLIKYCLAQEELVQLAQLRNDTHKIWQTNLAVLDKFKSVKKIKSEDLKHYYKALGEANAILKRFQGLDARLDGKRKLALTMEQSLYLTPRSRTGVAPEQKEPEEPMDEMDKMLKK